MNTNINQIISSLNSANNKYSDFEKLVLDYAVLRQKLSDSDIQSWNFKLSVEQTRQKLEELKSQFEEIRKEINSSSIDDLIAAEKKASETKDRVLKQQELNSVSQVAIGLLESKLFYIQELIRIKSRVNEVNEIDYYLENETTYFELFG